MNPINNIFYDLINKNELFDSHCHLNADQYETDKAEVVKNASSNHVNSVIDIGVNYKSSLEAVNSARTFPNQVFACVGIDPEVFIKGSDLNGGDNFDIQIELARIIELIDQYSQNIAMLGETGIDMYWNAKNDLSDIEQEESFIKQEELFRKHIELGIRTGLPLSIHSRESVDECLEILNSYSFPANQMKGVFHSLTPEASDDQESFYNKVNQILESNCLIGLNGIITYKSANLLRDAVLKVIKEKSDISDFSELQPTDLYKTGFIFETDGPFLAPEGKRGKRNEPANIRNIFEFIKSNNL